MKIFKLATAALAVVALASCSSDDLFGPSAETVKGKGVYVTVENMVDAQTTRAAYDPNGNQLYWQTNDEIQVFDDALQKYDKYGYTSDQLFANKKEKSYISEPKYALFGDVVSHGWDYETDGVTADFEIPSSWVWAETTVGESATEAYVSKLPQWGSAKEDEEYGIKADLRYLTGIAKINLSNVPGNVKYIGLYAYTNLAGTAKAKLSGFFRATVASGASDNDAAQLEAVDDYGASYKEFIFVDVSAASRDKSILYVPVIADTYKLLRLYYYTSGKPTDLGGLDAGSLYKSYKNVTFPRGQVLPITVAEFKTEGNTPSAVSKSLELQAEATSPVSITTTKAMNVADDDQTIIVPAMSQDVTINLASITESASDDYLYLSDNGNGYNKTFTLNVKGTTANTLKIWLDMPDATVVIASENVNAIAEVKGEAKSIVIGTTNDTDKTNVTAVSPDEGSSEVIINGEAGGLTILNNSNTTTVNINGKLNTTFDATTYSDETDANKYITVTLGDKAIVTGDLRVKHAITVPGKAQINGTLTSTGDITIAGVAADNKASVTGAVSSPANITVNGTAGAAVTSTTAGTITVGQFGAVTGAITSANGKITINGTASDDVTATKGDVEVTATGSVAKKVTANAGNVIISGTVKDVDVTGNATVSRTTEGEAVSGLIEIKGESRTLTLTGGYINELKASGSADKKRLTVSNTESIQTAIKGLATGSESINFGTSTWAGSKIKVSGSGTTYTGYVNTANIYTASQFAGYEGSAEAKLEANIALGTHAFTPVAAVASGNTFDGNSKTISGGVVTFATAASGDNVGLFKTIAADVKNLTIDGLKITATSSAAGKPLGGVGVLAGKATGGKITNVNVKNAEVSSDQLIVGGLVGEIAGDVTIEGASQGAGKDQFTTVAATITGKNNLGGLVGKVSSGTTTITIYKAAPSFTVTEVNTDDRTTNVNFGTVAPFVGTVASGATLQVAESADDAGYKATNVLSATQRTALGFKHNWVKSGEVYYDFYGRKAVGYCTEATGPTVKIASGNAAKVDDHQTAATADAASVAAAEASATTKELNIYVKE